MTPEQIELIQSSFRQLMRSRGLAADLFFARLFELDPSLRALFRGDLKRHQHNFIVMLSVITGSVAYLDDLLPTIEALARRHAAYGVRAEHFETAGEALVWMLRHTVGSGFTHQVEAAWLALYWVVSQTMIFAIVEEDALARAA